MSVFGKTAVLAAEKFRTGSADTPGCSWENAIAKLSDSPHVRRKCCPRNTYLGLCTAGFVRGVPPGAYVNSESQQNKYALAALDILAKNPERATTVSALWHDVLQMLHEPPNKSHDSQMNVVLALWENGYINPAP